MPWINKKVKQLITAKQNAYKFFDQNRKDTQIYNSRKFSKSTGFLNWISKNSTHVFQGVDGFSN